MSILEDIDKCIDKNCETDAEKKDAYLFAARMVLGKMVAGNREELIRQRKTITIMQITQLILIGLYIYLVVR